MQLPLYEPAEAIGDGPLAGVAASASRSTRPAGCCDPSGPSAHAARPRLSPSACHMAQIMKCVSDRPAPASAGLHARCRKLPSRNGAPVGLANTTAPGGLAMNLAMCSASGGGSRPGQPPRAYLPSASADRTSGRLPPARSASAQPPPAHPSADCRTPPAAPAPGTALHHLGQGNDLTDRQNRPLR
jgi:hypothetical protein